MRQSVSLFILLLFLGAAMVGFAGWAGRRLRGGEEPRAYFLWIAELVVKGAVLPLLVWAFINTGWLLQPYMPAIQRAQYVGKPWVPVFLGTVGKGAFVICSYWTALVLAWLTAIQAKSLPDDAARRTYRALCLTSVLGLCIPAGVLVLIGGWSTAGLGLALLLAPVAVYAPEMLQPSKPAPSYARAIGRIKFGKYAEAEWEIIRELEACENDFEGWLLLADLYATRYRDLPEAERTILETCEQPSVTPSQLSIALHRLADWQLNLGADPDAARRSLNLIISRLPGSHLARMAQLRINHLPRTRQEFVEQQTASLVPLPALGDSLDESPAPPATEEQTRSATALANDCVARLKEDPNDVAVREKLARTLTERLGQWRMGVEQIQLLLEMPEQPGNKRAEWLSYLGAWHLKYAQDRDAGLQALQRLADEYPDSPQAMAARYRLRKLKGQGPAPAGTNAT